MPRILIDNKYLVPSPGVTGELADANGLTTLQVPVNFPTLLEAFAMDPLRVASQCGITGVKLIGSPVEQSETMEFLVTYKFQGIGKQAWNGTTADAQATYQLLGIDTDSPAGSHPNLVNLKTKYGWVADDPNDPQGPGHFPYFMPDGTTKSPLYGTDAWENVAAEFVKTYVIKPGSASIAAWSAIGTIVANPPDLVKATGLTTQSGRNWKVRSPNIETLGSALRISEKWKLSGPGGWNADWNKYSGVL